MVLQEGVNKGLNVPISGDPWSASLKLLYYDCTIITITTTSTATTIIIYLFFF